jgi:hypothetical protein
LPEATDATVALSFLLIGPSLYSQTPGRAIAAVRFWGNDSAMEASFFVTDGKGQIAWKASPGMLSLLADLEREAEDDLAD